MCECEYVNVKAYVCIYTCEWECVYVSLWVFEWVCVYVECSVYLCVCVYECACVRDKRYMWYNFRYGRNSIWEGEEGFFRLFGLVF